MEGLSRPVVQNEQNQQLSWVIVPHPSGAKVPGLWGSYRGKEWRARGGTGGGISSADIGDITVYRRTDVVMPLRAKKKM